MNASGSPNDKRKNASLNADQTKAAKTKRQNANEEDSFFDNLADETVTPIFDSAVGCLIRPFIWLVTLPIRIVLKVIESIFD